MGKLENTLLLGAGTLILSFIIYTIGNFYYLGDFGVGLGVFIILWGIVKHGNI